MVSADDKVIIGIHLSGGECHDSPEGRKLLLQIGKPSEPTPLLMDKAYEGDETRQLAAELGYVPVVPPKQNRKEPWDYDKLLYKRRNVIERLHRAPVSIKEFRRVFTRYDKLDILFLAFVYFALSLIWIR